ncbi:MAG: aldehyde dehydrogenase family protein, partial [Solirubrobacteraceae bacterium]
MPSGTLEVLEPATEAVLRELPRADASDVDRAVQRAAAAFPAWRAVAPSHRAALLRRVSDAVSAQLEPLGVVGLIVPRNFPLTIAAWKMGPAVAAGNTVVLKPAELTPLSALRFSEIALDAGLPEGVLNVVVGPGSTCGARLVQHADVAKIAFTG